MNRNYYTISLSLLGVLKLVLDSFGINLITDKNTNDVANAVATILSFVGVIMTHLKGRPQIQFKAFVSRLFKRKGSTAVPANTINTSQVTPVTKTVQTTTTASEKSNSTAPKVEQPEQPEPAAPINTTNNTVQK